MKRFWGWELATYLFLGGLGGGMLAFAAVINLLFRDVVMLTQGVLVWGVLVAVICLVVGTALLVFELGQWPVFERAFVTRKAVIKWGAVLLSVSMIGAVVYLLWNISWLDFVENGGILPSVWVSDVALTVSGITGACVMIYTGVLLSSLKARPFWNTPALPVLFTVSALSTGACLLSMCVGSFPFFDSWMNPELTAAGMGVATEAWNTLTHELVHWLHGVDAALIVLELLVILLFVLLQFCASNVHAKAVAEKWVRGSWAAIFWGLMVCCGLIIPLIFNLSGVEALSSYASPIMALLGGALLRFMILWSCDRRLDEGEYKYYSRLAQKHEDFMDYWQPGREYFEIVNADQFDDMPVVEPAPKTSVKEKFVWAVTKDHGNLPEPNPAFPTYRRIQGTDKVYKVFREHLND